MLQTAIRALSWPTLSFGPVNLWSLPAAWSRDPLAARPAPRPTVVASQVNPVIRQVLAHR